MKSKIYLTHNCDFHASHLTLPSGESCCLHSQSSEGVIVGDLEMELYNNDNEVITYHVPESGMLGVKETLANWSGQYGSINIEYVE